VPASDIAPFVGSWTLLSYELRLPTGVVLQPMGDRPIGCILYQPNGRMSAQVADPESAPLANEDSSDATSDEAARAWRSYVGYWGTFTVNAGAGVVVHHVEGAWFPNWIGQDQVRLYRFSGDRLILEADSATWHACLVWQRIP
jgi:hypothetical protein